MNKNNNFSKKNKEEEFLKEIEKRQKRKIKARERKNRTIWMGLGLFGVIGWSVMIPTIIGIIVGLWMDQKWPGQISWTLMLLFAGIILGCLNAWYWVQKERKIIEREQKEE